MMRTVVIAILLIIIGGRASAQSSGFGKPLLWYTEYDPWAMFIGADGPTFTVYQSGQVIYWKERKYHLVVLSSSDLQDLLAKFQMTDTFFLRSKRFSASESTDQPTCVLLTNLDTLKRFSIYGNMEDAGTRARVPRQLDVIYELVHSFEDDQAVDWIPDKIEIMLSAYDNALGKPIPWPANWPDLNSARSRRWQNGGGTIFLDRRYFPALRRLLASRKEKQAILINGKKFYAEYRFPLPGVDSLMAANRDDIPDQ